MTPPTNRGGWGLDCSKSKGQGTTARARGKWWVVSIKQCFYLVMTLPRQIVAVCGCRRRPILYTVVAVVVIVTVTVRFKSHVLMLSPSSAQDNPVPGGGSLLYSRSSYSHKQKSPTSSRDPTTALHHHRYVLGMNYWEQFNMAVKNYFKLACLANQWNATIIRPFTLHSRLYGLDNVLLDDYMNTTDTAYDLDLILDPDSVDSVLKQSRLRPTTSLEELLRHGDRNLIFLHFISTKPAREYKISSRATNHFLKSAFRKSAIVDCKDQPELVKLSQLVASNLNARLGNTPLETTTPSQPFTVHRYFCVNLTHGLISTNLESDIKHHSGNTTIVVINWRGTTNTSFIKSSAKGAHASKKTIMHERCSDKASPKLHQVRFSQKVLSASEKFKQELGIGDEQYVVVHIRTEKMFLRQSRFPRLLKNCIIEGLQKRDEFLSRQKERIKVLYFDDTGAFGSQTCKNCKGTGEYLRVLEGYKLSVSHFLPSHYNFPLDSGFVAAVEMNVMSHASHLILIGGGAFQNQLHLHYEDNQVDSNRKTKAIRVCSTDQQAAEVTRHFSSPSAHQ